jgi:hypothetical protein
MEHEVDFRWFYALIALFVSVAAIDIGLTWVCKSGYDHHAHRTELHEPERSASR